MNYADIDIDMKNRNDLLQHVKHVPASIARPTTYKKHNSGVYFQPIPVNPFERMSTIDHNDAAKLGYFKIDLLNNSVYQGVESEKHLSELIEQEPDWTLLAKPDTVKDLFHLSQHIELTTRMKPGNIDQLAMLLALIRPGKSYLRYRSWDVVKREVWQIPKTKDGYYFKKSHSYAFALAIVVQLNLIKNNDGS